MTESTASIGQAGCLRFSPAFNTTSIGPDLLILLSDQRRRILRGSLLFDLSILIDGGHTLCDLIRILSGRYPPEKIERSVEYLFNHGYIVPASKSVGAESIFWSNIDGGHHIAASTPQLRTVSVRSMAEAPVEPLVRAFEAAGLQVGTGGAVTVVVTDSYLNPKLRDINLEHLRLEMPWVLVKPTGVEALIGPLFTPGKSACWECLAHRLRQHQVLEKALSVWRAAPGGYLNPSLASVYALLAVELLKHLNAGDTRLSDPCVLSLNFSTLSMQIHRVVFRPQCQTCNTPASASSSLALEIPLAALRAAKTPLSNEGFPDRVAHLVSPITGIVGSLDETQIPGPHDGIYLYSCGLNFAREHSLEGLLSLNPANYSQGKGTTRHEARQSALFEAIERYSLVFDGTEASVREEYLALGDAAIHPNNCMLFSDRQLSGRECSGAGRAVLDVPEPFVRNAKILWAPARSLISNERRFLPMALCFGNVPPEEGAKYCWADSNGVAAGSSLCDAVIRAFLEVVERDAVGIWWFNLIARPCFEITDGTDEQCYRIAKIFSSRNRNLWLCEVTSDFGIPVWVAISSDSEGNDLWFGFGCHFNARRAITKALSEVCQRLPAGRKGLQWTDPTRTLGCLPFLKCESPKSLRVSTLQPPGSEDELELTLRSIANAETDLIALDMTRPDIGVPVARVFVPGMRHLHPRFAPGRLFDVPVKMKWLSRPRTEDELLRNSVVPKN